MNRAKIGAIDVGTTKVCTIMGDVDSEGGLRILGVGIAPSLGLQKGMVVNADDARVAIAASVKKAESVAGYKLDSAYVGVTGRHINSVNNRGVIAVTRGDQLVRPADLKRVLQVARSVKIPADQKVLHIIPRHYAIDGQEGVKNPIGMHGFRLDVEAHIITAAIASVKNLTKCIRSLGIDIDDLVMEPLASAEAVLTEEERQNGVMLADIGGGTTDIAVFKDDTIYYTSVIPVAGQTLTRDLSVGLGLSFDLAEEMKKKYGDVTPLEKTNGEFNEPLMEDGHSVSYRDLSDIIRIRVDELMRLLVLELPHSDVPTIMPSGIVLTGGASKLPGIAELAQEVTKVPVKVGTPVGLPGVSDSLCDPAYATSVGLLLWKMKNKDSQTWERKGGLRRLFSNLFRFFR
ncbi:MAG: cell division protein FtsA [Dehalococcoidales bacterium]|jgi:cell division protein FtsA|nr:cell division protein FtsA [Dehalococcoidales bacterium]MDP6738063.1 cell division protein FtsA [Dehalococcoidales bacterium]|tara:strand:- start:1905 stop:3110 length:1206 start_codon:yes stop_codon:yes gene_type:complete